jgi:NAD(P)-dependent dehydrogenase (short-subunit alcohol dehydrogenase family)
MSLKGKSILIAGATGGLGQSVATELAARDASLMVVHHGDSDRATSLRNKLKDRGDVNFHSCDFTVPEDIHDAIETFFDHSKEPYGFVNLIGDPARVDWQKAQINHMQESFLRNASAPLQSAKEFGLHLREKKLPGSIVLFSSMQGVYPFEGSLYYGTPKAALIHGAKILAKEFGGDPFIRVNVIAPGVNQAGMAEESIKKGKYQKLVDQKIIPHYGDPASIGRLTVYLLEPGLYMTGQVLLYDGGLTLRRDLLR